MPINAYLDDLPLDLQLDLLVDGELAEDRRRELLAVMDQQPAQWRTLALRFLQQQTEKQSVRALMAGGNLIPVDSAPPVHRPVIGRVGWVRITAVAAGLLIAVTSALITLLVVKPLGSGNASNLAEFNATLPPEVVSGPTAVSVRVPVIPAGSNDMFSNMNMANRANTDRAFKSSILVQPDGRGGYIWIPVSTSKQQVY